MENKIMFGKHGKFTESTIYTHNPQNEIGSHTGTVKYEKTSDKTLYKSILKFVILSNPKPTVK